MATTFGAISADTEALKDTISGGPPTLQTGIDVLPEQQTVPGRVHRALERRCKPGVRQLRLALPT